MRKYSLILLCLLALAGKCFDATPLLQWVLADAAFSPLSIADCVLWLDPSDSSTMSLAGSSVTNMADKSSSGFNAFKSSDTSTTWPTLANNIINGLPAVQYDGGDTLRTQFVGAWPLTGFVIVKPTAFTSFDYFIGVLAGGAGGVCFGVDSATTSRIAVGSSINMVFDFDWGTATHIYAWQTTSTAHQIWDTGSSVKSGSHGGSAHILTWALGGINLSGTITPFYSGYIGEVLIYNRVLTDSEREQVEAYLMDKWGL